jgi:hypothetical protein
MIVDGRSTLLPIVTAESRTPLAACRIAAIV